MTSPRLSTEDATVQVQKAERQSGGGTLEDGAVGDGLRDIINASALCEDGVVRVVRLRVHLDGDDALIARQRADGLEEIRRSLLLLVARPRLSIERKKNKECHAARRRELARRAGGG